MTTPFHIARLLLTAAVGLAKLTAWAAEPSTQSATLETDLVRLQISPENGRYEILDKKAGITWYSHPLKARFGEATVRINGQSRLVSLDRCEVLRSDQSRSLELTFHPVDAQPDLMVRVYIRMLADNRTLEFSYSAAPDLSVDSIRLLDNALWITDTDTGYALVPVREGLLVPADSGLAFTQRFDTYAYEGCHMAMLGLCKGGAAALVTWDDPYVLVDLQSTLNPALATPAKQLLSPSLVLHRTAKSCRVQLLGRGDHVTVARAYRKVAQDKGWLVTWEEKLKGHPERARLFGAINYKLWSVLDRQMNETSTQEERVRVNWTFDEAAQVAEHLKNDLKLERVLFLMGGWIRRGYDNQHPDILPAAPECGGNDAFADCARRVRQLGYVLGLHDNYQDMYKDAPSWDETFLMKTPDGQIARGGHWAGGRAFLTCSKKAVELAQRPQNLPAVRELTRADAYFIDTTYAAGLQECFDPNHPLTRADDMHWKQVISDYARELYGIFGSECGREWAIPHSDFFEGLTGVSGRLYHNAELVSKVGGTVVPLFELVYRDSIALYGKYGYDPAKAAPYVLHHIILGRPLHYHSIPQHLYWKETRPPDPVPPEPIGLRPAVTEVSQPGPHSFNITYAWSVEKPPASDWRVFVHFTDAEGNIRFQNDHTPIPPTSAWKAGSVTQGPFTVAVPDGLAGAFDVRMGVFQPSSGARALLDGADDGERRYKVGQLKVAGEKITFQLRPTSSEPARLGPDPALFTRADNGWAAGLHSLDRFVKNTYEILSPLNEITARMPMTAHQFLTENRQVQRSLFGEGAEAVEVIVNASTAEYRHKTAAGKDIVLPPHGFVIVSPRFAAFLALNWNGLRYEEPVLFTLRSLDAQPLERSRQVRVFHGFGDPRVRVGQATRTVPREEVVAATP